MSDVPKSHDDKDEEMVVLEWRVIESYRKAAKIVEAELNTAYDLYKAQRSGQYGLFHDVNLQVRSFSYELILETLSMASNAPVGYAKAVATKGFIHRIVEFNKHLQKGIVPALVGLAEQEGLPFTQSTANVHAKRWRSVTSRVRKWEQLRNKATGHYDSDVPLVVKLLEGVDLAETLTTGLEFAKYVTGLLQLFSDASNKQFDIPFGGRNGKGV